ncbi:hypothetical protein [Aliikangiella sp. IMCC44632]
MRKARVCIFISMLLALNLNAIEYVGIFDERKLIVPDSVLHVDNQFEKYYEKKISKQELLKSILDLKESSYKEYFYFYYSLSVLKKIYSKEELKLLKLNDSPEGVLANCLYVEYLGEPLECLEDISALPFVEAQIYYSGILIRKGIDPSSGVSKLTKLSANGNAFAKSVLGVHYSRNKNYHKANGYLREATKDGVPLAFATLGINYYYGRGVEKNRDEAERLFKIARLKGDFSTSSYMLGLIYRDRKNLQISIDYFEEALEHNEYAASYELGKIYMDRLEDESDLRNAQKYLGMCASKGIKGCFVYVIRMHLVAYRLFKDEKELKLAIEYAKELYQIDNELGAKLFSVIDKATSEP